MTYFYTIHAREIHVRERRKRVYRRLGKAPISIFRTRICIAIHTRMDNLRSVWSWARTKKGVRSTLMY